MYLYILHLHKLDLSEHVMNFTVKNCPKLDKNDQIGKNRLQDREKRMILNNIGHWFSRGPGQCLEKTLREKPKVRKEKALAVKPISPWFATYNRFKPQLVTGEHGLDPGPNN